MLKKSVVKFLKVISFCIFCFLAMIGEINSFGGVLIVLGLVLVLIFNVYILDKYSNIFK